MEALPRHKMRINFDVRCPVCHAEPRYNCVIAPPSRNDRVMGEILDDQAELEKDQIAFFEFTILSSVSQLEALDVHHYLVRALRSALQVNSDG